MVARTGRSSLRGEARAGGADAGDERGAECAEGPPQPPTRSESALAADLTSARCRGKIGSDVAWCRVSRDTPRALSTARRPRRTPHRPRVSRLSSARSPTWVKPPRNSVTAVRASPRRNTSPPLPGKSREKISRRCSLSFRTSPATREATGAPVAPHARLARLDRDRTPRRSRARRTPTRLDRGPGSVGVSSRRRRCRTRPFYPGVLSDSIRPN